MALNFIKQETTKKTKARISEFCNNLDNRMTAIIESVHEMWCISNLKRLHRLCERLDLTMKAVLGSMRFTNKLHEIRLRRFYKNLAKPTELFNPTYGIKRILMKRVSGILHVGAHTGQEAAFYSSYSLPVIWIEADPDIFL